jgi:hypothetical protein
MNASRRECQINRTPTDQIPLAWIGSALEKLDFVSAASEKSREEPARQTAADERKLRCHAVVS